MGSENAATAVLFAEMFETGALSPSATACDRLIALREDILTAGGQVILSLGGSLVATLPDAATAARTAIAARDALAGGPVDAAFAVHHGATAARATIHAGAQAGPGDILLSADAVAAIPPDFPASFAPAATASGVALHRLQPPPAADASDATVIDGPDPDSTVIDSDTVLEAPEAASEPVLVLTVDGHETILTANGAAFDIGRDATCGVTLDNALVSRRHATVSAADGGFVIRDLSRNGTFIQGDDGAALVSLKQEQAPLTGRGEISLGRVGEAGATLRFEVRNPPTAR